VIKPLKSQKYELVIDTFIDFEASLYDSNTQLPCFETLLFIFENQTTITQFSQQVDYLQCRYDHLNQSTSSVYNFTSRLTISNMTETTLDAFLGQLIFLSLDINNIMLECEGLADYTITSDGLNCTDPKQLKFCQRRG
jgi:hypothetical protein